MFSVGSVPRMYHRDQQDSESRDGAVSGDIRDSQRGPETWNVGVEKLTDLGVSQR